jgi:hypothetical protein
VSPVFGSRANAALLTLFANGESGAWIDPADATKIKRDSAGLLSARLKGAVRKLLDKSGNGNHAMPSAASSTIRYMQETVHSSKYIRQSMEPNEGRLSIDFGADLGNACTIVFANYTSVEFREGQTVGSSYEIPKSFWQFLIINRSLTDDEKASVTAYFQRKVPDVVTAYDFFVDEISGSDSNDGLTEATAKKTLSAAFTQLLASASGSRLCVLPGTYSDSISTGSASVAKTHYIHVPRGGVVLDGGETPEVGTSSAFAVDAQNYTLHLFGDGNFEVKNWGNNGLGAGADASTSFYTYDVVVHDCDDDHTCHGAKYTDYRSTSYAGKKSAIAHVSASIIYHEQGVAYSAIGSSIGLATLGELATSFDCFQMDFLPDTAATTTWASFQVSCNSSGSGTLGALRRYRECRFGGSHLTPPATFAASSMRDATYEDCYFNGYSVQAVDTSAMTNLFNRCFGPAVSIRARRTASVIHNVDNCVFAGGTFNDHPLDAYFYSSPNDICGAGRVKNSVLINSAVGIYVVSTAGAADAFNSNWLLLNNLFYNNTANMSAGVTADGTDVTGQDPLIVDITSDDQEDWHVNAGSPTLGAGVDGADIGLGLAA